MKDYHERYYAYEETAEERMARYGRYRFRMLLAGATVLYVAGLILARIL